MVERLSEEHRVEVAQQSVEAARVERYGGKVVNRFEAEVLPEHRVQDRYYERIVERIEYGVQHRIEEIGYGILAERLCEAQKSEVGSKHLFRFLLL